MSVLKQVYDIHADGHLKGIYVAYVDENGVILEEDKIHMIATDMQDGLQKPKWNGTEWIEGATQEEIDELTKVEPSPPTEIDLLKAELTKTNEMLLDMMELLIGGM